MRSSEPSGDGPTLRLRGVDAARGVALLAMMAVHVFPSEDGNGDVTTTHALVSGRAAALFVVLAGVGLALAFRRVESRTERWALLLPRAVLVGAVGLALGTLESGVAVILPYYALLFALAPPLLPLRKRTLTLLAAAVALAGPVVGHLARPLLGEPDQTNPTPEDLWPAADAAQLAGEILLTGYYPVLAWGAYLAAGLAVGKLDLHSKRTAGTLSALGVVLHLGAAGASELLLRAGGYEALARTYRVDETDVEAALERSLYGTTPTESWWWLATDAPHSSTPLDLVGTIGSSLVVLGAVLLVPRALRWGLAPLAAIGSMTLTLYSLHVTFLHTDLLVFDPTLSWTVQAVALVAFALGWRRLSRRGPLEAVVAAASRAAGRAVRKET